MSIHIVSNADCSGETKHLPNHLNIHDINTKNRNQRHLQSASLSGFQRGVFYLDIRTFNGLPDSIRNLMND
jgi:hypothetical protein